MEYPFAAPQGAENAKESAERIFFVVAGEHSAGRSHTRYLDLQPSRDLALFALNIYGFPKADFSPSAGNDVCQTTSRGIFEDGLDIENRWRLDVNCLWTLQSQTPPKERSVAVEYCERRDRLKVKG